MIKSHHWAIVATFMSFVASVASASAGEKGTPDFRRDILPLLKNRCVRCHGPAVKKALLNLALPPGIARGGENGRMIVPGKPDDSLLYQRVAADEMPEGEPLPADEKKLLRDWIAAGAQGLPSKVSEKPDGDEHWAFQKLQTLSPPNVRDSTRIYTAVDRFLQRELESHKLELSAEADRYTLIRRVSFDLTGLPPAPDDVTKFIQNSSATAYEDMVEHYLASPRYGERWGKFWLDAAGYADSNGYFFADTDRPLAYRYRDYVIRSINADKPWDQFIREQLAGDELAGYNPAGEVTPAMVELLEAAHYLRNSPDGTNTSDGNPDERRTDKYAVLEGTMQIMGASLLGLTVQCAKCHDHKFEPITQRDFYSLQAVIYPAFNVEKWAYPNEREISTASASEIAAWKSELKEIDGQIAKRRERFRNWLNERTEHGQVLFLNTFDGPNQKLADAWTNIVPGDSAPAGQPAVNIDSPTAPGAHIADGGLQIVESGRSGHRALSTKQTFDWTPNETEGWIQVTFDLLQEKSTALYVGYYLALHDFNDTSSTSRGNVLIDGAEKGKAKVFVDYPGSDSVHRGEIGATGYRPGRNYGVRITNLGDGNFELTQVVDGLIEDGALTLKANDLPDGGFGFEYCCGRSFAVDNVRIEASDSSLANARDRTQLVEVRHSKRAEFEADVKKLKARKPVKPGRLAVVSDLSPEPPDVFLLARGDYRSPKEKVDPAGPAVLAAEPISASSRSKYSTGRRLAFANWLTKPDSRAAALLARVTVNRFWQHHFGTGIVATADNLGYSGAPPTHPELLEYLAAEFVRGGWSTKAIHRLILNSAAYRQSSRATPVSANGKLSPSPTEEIDAENHLLSHFPLRRLDAEAVRDGMLAASGELELGIGGPYVPTIRNDEGDVVVDEKTAGARRRSIYLQQRRTQVTGMLDVFDAPSMVFSCTRRAPTTVPLQSLKLLNSSFVRARAESLAKRIATDAGNDPDKRIRQAFMLLATRPPTAEELTAARTFIAEQPSHYKAAAGTKQEAIKPHSAEALAWTDFCHMLLASNVYLYVD